MTAWISEDIYHKVHYYKYLFTKTPETLLSGVYLVWFIDYKKMYLRMKSTARMYITGEISLPFLQTRLMIT